MVGPLKLALQTTDGVDRVGRLAVELLERFDIRRDEAFFAAGSERDHCISMCIRGKRLFLLVGRRAGRHEENASEVKTLLGSAGDREVSAMNRIESSAEQSDVHSESVSVISFQFSVSGCKAKVEVKRER